MNVSETNRNRKENYFRQSLISPTLTLQLEMDKERKANSYFPSTLDSKLKYSVIVPAYNEEKRIAPFLASLITEAPGNVEIIVVCDGNDDTSRIVKEFGDKIILLQYSNRLGKGKAILEGFRAARTDVIGFVDADGAIPAQEVLRLAGMVSEKTPSVIGSRWVEGSIILRSEPLSKLIASRLFHFLALFILGLTEKDTQCGLKFFHRRVLSVVINRITIANWMIDVALLYHVKLLGLRTKEVGITWAHQEESKFSVRKAAPIMLSTLIGLRLVHLKKLGSQFRFLSKIRVAIDRRL